MEIDLGILPQLQEVMMSTPRKGCEQTTFGDDDDNTFMDAGFRDINESAISDHSLLTGCTMFSDVDITSDIVGSSAQDEDTMFWTFSDLSSDSVNSFEGEFDLIESLSFGNIEAASEPECPHEEPCVSADLQTRKADDNTDQSDENQSDKSVGKSQNTTNTEDLCKDSRSGDLIHDTGDRSDVSAIGNDHCSFYNDTSMRDNICVSITEDECGSNLIHRGKMNQVNATFTDDKPVTNLATKRMLLEQRAKTLNERREMLKLKNKELQEKRASLRQKLKYVLNEIDTDDKTGHDFEMRMLKLSLERRSDSSSVIRKESESSNLDVSNHDEKHTDTHMQQRLSKLRHLFKRQEKETHSNTDQDHTENNCQHHQQQRQQQRQQQHDRLEGLLQEQQQRQERQRQQQQDQERRVQEQTDSQRMRKNDHSPQKQQSQPCRYTDSHGNPMCTERRTKSSSLLERLLPPSRPISRSLSGRVSIDRERCVRV